MDTSESSSKDREGSVRHMEKEIQAQNEIISAQKEQILHLKGQVSLLEKQKKAPQMEKCALAAEKERDKWHEKWKQQQAALYTALSDLEEEKGKNALAGSPAIKGIPGNSIFRQKSVRSRPRKNIRTIRITMKPERSSGNKRS